MPDDADRQRAPRPRPRPRPGVARPAAQPAADAVDEPDTESRSKRRLGRFFTGSLSERSADSRPAPVKPGNFPGVPHRPHPEQADS